MNCQSKGFVKDSWRMTGYCEEVLQANLLVDNQRRRNYYSFQIFIQMIFLMLYIQEIVYFNFAIFCNIGFMGFLN